MQRIITSIYYKLFKTRIVEYRRMMERLRSSSPQEIEEYQRNKLERVISYALNNSAYYKNIYTGNRIIEANTTPAFDITSFPILTKKEIQGHLADIAVPEKISGAIAGFTGGSTGTPVKYYYDEECLQKMDAALQFFYQWSGWKPGERVLHFWGAGQDLGKLGSVKNRVAEWIKGEKYIGAYRFDDSTLEQWTKEIKSYNPVLVQGYASILAAIARYSNAHNIKYKALKGVYSTAEILYLKDRHEIEKAFGCKVFDQYGCREIPGIACQCDRGNMHINPAMAYVESVKEEESSEHKLIVTSLVNFTMPLLRYEVGDMGSLKNGVCECGMPFPMIEMGLCRSNDILITASGRSIYPSYFVHLLDEYPEIKQYQYQQEKAGKIKLLLQNCMDSERIASMQLELQNKIQQEMGNEMLLTIETVKEIDRTMSGKYRYVLNLIQD